MYCIYALHGDIGSTRPDFGQKDEHFEILDRFIRDNRTEKGIRTNMERFILTARKP